MCPPHLGLSCLDLSYLVLCLLQELVKKGMEPLQKVRLLHAINLAQMLALVPVRTKGSPSSGAGKGGGASGRSPAGAAGKGWGSSSGAGNDEEDDDDEEEGAEEELGEVVNVFLLELLACWSSYEDLLMDGVSTGVGARAGGGGGSSSSAGNPPLALILMYPLTLILSLSPILSCTSTTSNSPRYPVFPFRFYHSRSHHSRSYFLSFLPPLVAISFIFIFTFTLTQARASC